MPLINDSIPISTRADISRQHRRDIPEPCSVRVEDPYPVTTIIRDRWWSKWDCQSYVPDDAAISIPVCADTRIHHRERDAHWNLQNPPERDIQRMNKRDNEESNVIFLKKIKLKRDLAELEPIAELIAEVATNYDKDYYKSD